jgi:hypothetical protein
MAYTLGKYMSVPFLVLIAIAIPAVIAGALLPPLLLHDQMQTASATFPERLRESLGVDREYKFSVWELVIFIVLSLSAFTNSHIQEIIAICSSILLAVWAASRSWTYLEPVRKVLVSAFANFSRPAIF